MNFKSINKFIYLFLFPVYLFSQEPIELSLKDAISYAVENKSDAIKAQLQIENAEYVIQESKANLLPQLSGNANITNNPLLQKSALPGELIGQPGTTLFAEFGQTWNPVVGAQFTQNIFDQSIFTGLKAARSSREFYQINANLTKEDLIQKVAQNYYQVYIERERAKVIDSSIANTQQVRAILQGQFENGLAKKIDLDRLDVKLSNLISQRQQSINALELQENILKFFMGMPIQTQIILPPKEFEISTLPKEDEQIDIESLSPYRLLDTQKQLLQYQKKAIQAEYYPTLNLEANYNYQGLGNDFPIFAGDEGDANWFEVASVALNLRIPILNGFATRSRVRQADVEIRSLTEDINDTRLSLQLDFENAKSNLRNSLLTINNQRENVELAENVVQDTENNYYNGLATLTDLLDAQSSLIESQNNLNQSLLDYKIAEIQLLKAKDQLITLLN